MDSARWQKIKDIFDEALKLAPEERAPFLGKACDGDEEIRRETEALLASHDESDSFMEDLAAREVANVIAGEPERLKTGQSISHYRIVKPIGAGGMGRVYLARDMILQRKVALKLLSSDYPNKNELLKRFEREACAASALNHPNILTVHEIFVEGDLHCLATEFIDGITLREKMQEKRLPFGEIIDIAVQIAAALTAAHSAGVVHRDIKPENIMLRRDGIVKVLDFGLAKTKRVHDESALYAPEEEAKPAAITNPQAVLGTVSYLSPEQARGETVDGRTDVFSLGVMLYEMSAGRLPFAGETVAEALRALLNEDPAPLTHFSPDCPAELRRIIGKALRKDRSGRYQTMKSLLAELKALRPEAARTPAAVYPAGEKRPSKLSAEFITGEIGRRKPAAFLGSLVMLGLIGAGLWFSFFRPPGVRHIGSIAVIPFVNESGGQELEYLSDGMTETLIGNLSQFPDLRVKAQATVLRYKGTQASARTLGQELGVETILKGHVVQHGDDLVLYLELIDAESGDQLWGEQYKRKLVNIISLQNEIARDVSEKLRIKLSAE